MSYTPTQRRIKNLAKYLRRRFLQKQLRTSVAICFWRKTPSQKPGRAPSICHETVVRKFPIYKLKQKRANKVKT